ncbi:MAG: GUN4 domain-containing protein [Cyanophyceae cyanobacterium]
MVCSNIATFSSNTRGWVVWGLVVAIAVTFPTARMAKRKTRLRPQQITSLVFEERYRPIMLEGMVDYNRLQDLLMAQNYPDADWETYRVVLEVADREREGWLRHTDIDDFPGPDLRAIDRLWVAYSGGRFGFSVQKRIYQNLGGTREYNEEIWQAFGDRVGWRGRDNWLSYAQLTFNLNAPEGHLPAAGGVWVGGVPRVVGWGHGRYLLSRPDL